MMRMYDYSKSYVELEELLLDGNLDREAYLETIESIEGDAKEKAENLAKMADNFIAQELMLKEEVAKLNAKRKTLQNNSAFLINELEVFHKASGIKQAGMYKLNYRKLPPSVEITNEEDIPEAYWKIKIDYDKAGMAKKLKDGEEVPGAYLNTGKTKFEVKK